MTAREILESCGFTWNEDAPLDNVLMIDHDIKLDTELEET